MSRKLALFVFASFSIFVSAALASEDEAVIARRPGTYQAAIGDPVVTVIIQRALPNAFGFDDIFGRKVQTGQIDVIFMGVSDDAKVKLRRVDVSIHTNASTLTRSPGFVYGQAYGSQNVWGTYSGGAGTIAGSGTYQGNVVGTSPPPESTVVMQPRITDFLLAIGKSLPLTSGDTLTILTADDTQATFRLKRSR